MGDGSVKSLSPRIAPHVLKALHTSHGGEQINWANIDGL